MTSLTNVFDNLTELMFNDLTEFNGLTELIRLTVLID